MPTQRIPLIQKPYPALDRIIPPDMSASLIDGMIDERGALRRRPGLKKWCNVLPEADFIASAGQGSYYWDAKGIFLHVAAGRVFANSTGDPAAFYEITNTMNKLHPTRPVSFAASGEWLMMANGRVDQTILEWNGDPARPATFSTTAPRNIRHVAYIDTYFLCLPSQSQSWYYTNADTEGAVFGVTPKTWNQLPLSADGNPDVIKTLAVGWREILLIGELSTEVWYNSGASLPNPPFARMEGAFIEQGISAPYSLTLVDNTWFWLNHQREVIRLNGRSPAVVSLPIRAQLANYKDVADAVGFRYDRFYCLTFPTANVTWVFDPLLDAWYQWGKWESEGAKYDRWLVNGVVFIPRWGVHIASSRRDASLYFVHPNLCTDDGDPLVLEYTSGLIDLGTYRRKVSHELVLKIKRGLDEENIFNLTPAQVAAYFYDLPAGARCVPYEYRFPDPGDGSTVSVTGTLPTGVTFDAETQTLRGYPTQNGTFPVIISVRQLSGLVFNTSVDLVIADTLPTIKFQGEA